MQNLKQIFRSLLKYKSFTIINLLGLSIGVAAVMLIFMIADYEKSFDKQQGNAKDIFRVVSKSDRAGKPYYEANVPYPTAKLLRNEYPGIQATEIHFSSDVNVRIGNQSPFAEKNIVFADSLFFNVFDFSGINKFLVAGNAVKALSEPNKVILTESAARRYFGSSNPIGKVIKLDAKLDVEVAAIVKDMPATTHLPFSMIISYASLTKEFIGGFNLDGWGLVSGGFCYVKLGNKTPVTAVERALYSIVQRNSEDERDKRKKFYLQP